MYLSIELVYASALTVVVAVVDAALLDLLSLVPELGQGPFLVLVLAQRASGAAVVRRISRRRFGLARIISVVLKQK